MTSMCLKPGINNISISSEDGEGPIIMLKNDDDNKIYVNFSLTGMMNLTDPINSSLQTFYLYIFLTYQNGGKEVEVISSSRTFCNKDILESESLHFTTTLDMPLSKVYKERDFTWNFYSVNIVYSKEEPEDGSDLNFLLNDPYSSLFNTKINVVFVGD